MDEKKKPSRAEAIDKLWRKGVLIWKLDENQKEVKQIFEDTEGKLVVFGASRQLGKSYLLTTMGIEYCLRNPNTIVKYVAPTTKMVRTITKSLMREILADCPNDLRPRFHVQENTWKFKNGSEMQFAGAESDNIESIRGGKAHLVLIDEAGFISDLRYGVNSVLLPTTTTTNGKILLASTPPKSANHDFVYYMEKAKLDDAYIEKTIYDNPRLSERDIDLLAEEAGGHDSVDFRREYMVEVITDIERAVVPEFNDEAEVEIVKDWKRPPYYDCYVGMDLGFRDFTVVLFGYYDFRNAKVVIEDEIIINGTAFTTDALASKIKAKEQALWGDKTPMIRVSDNNLIVINDLARLHKLYFVPTAKDDKHAAINQLRMLINERRLIISPKCKILPYHLKNAIWNKSRKTYERGADGSHYDAVDALIYFIRNVNFSSNPYPPGYDLDSSNMFFIEGYDNPDTPLIKMVKKMFTINKSK